MNLIPGQVATLTVTVANQGEYVDHYHLTVEGAGINPSWVTGPDRPIQLNPGRESSIPLQVLVPREPGSLAREYPVTIRAVSEEDSSDSSAATAVWNIVRFSSTELTLVPRRATGWHRKVFLLTLGNGGNAPEEYAFSAVDDENKLRYDFLHGGQQRGNDTLPLAPGRAERVPLAVVAPWRLVGRTERILFTVTAKPADGPEQTVPAEFNQRTLFPVWSLVLMALALAGLALLIVYLRQPASPEIKSFTVAPPAVKSNTPVTIRWDVRKASSVSLQIASKGAEEVLVVKPKGHTTDVPLVPTKYTLIAENKGRPPVQDWRQVRIIPPQVGQPVISSFTVEPGAVDPGNPVTVRWNVHNAQLVKLQMASKDAQTIQVVPTAGRVVDRPQNTTKYTLIVSNQGQAPLKNWRIARIILPPTAVPAPPSNGSGSGSGSGSGAGSGSGTKKSSGAGAKKGGSNATKPKPAPKPQPTHHAAPAPVVHPTAKPAPKPTPAPRPKPTSAVLQAQNFLGTWNVTNTPPGPNTLSRLVITQPKPTSVSVHAFYSCAAGACDRGTGNGGLSASGQTRTLSAKIPVSGGYLSITATRVGHNLLHVFVTPHTTTCLGCARQSLYFLRQPVTQTSVATPAAP